MAETIDRQTLARLELRRQGRRILKNPADSGAHLARLSAALTLAGAEPVQGALADLFASFGVADLQVKQSAMQMARPRLATHVARWFDAQTAQAQLPSITPLATRWSVLARPSADITTRARRCSVDDSRALAQQMLQALDTDDVQAQQEFLHHCVTCHDNLAFMLVRREVIRTGVKVPDGWEDVSHQLQQAQALA